MAWPDERPAARDDGTAEEPDELLGRGRLGETWSSRDAGGHRLAAKRLRIPETRDPERAADLLRPLTALRHRSVVPVREVRVTDGEVWVDSELDRGIPLHRLLVVAALTAGQAALITEGILEAVDALRAAGVPHGDLHPGNVHVGPTGQVRLGDSGLLPLLRTADPVGPESWDSRDAGALARLLGRVTGQAGGPVRRQAPDWRSPAGVGLQEAVDSLRRSGGE